MTIPTIPLVPGDDRTLQITLTDSAGDALDLTGYTVSVAKIAWSGGSIDPLTVGLASAASGIVTVTLTDTQSATIPMGRVSALTLQLASAADDKTTYYYAYVNGVPIVSDTTLSSTAIVGIQGQAGSTFRAFPGAPDNGVGNNNDIGIRADTGQIYSKVSGAWVLLDDQPLADSITAAAASASSASGSAGAADASATAASGSASAASASASAASASASSASGSASAAASSASAASSSETAAAASETAAASSATDAQTAQGLAEDARDAAQTAQTAAELAETNAQAYADAILYTTDGGSASSTYLVTQNIDGGSANG